MTHPVTHQEMRFELEPRQLWDRPG
jgi:hypothetical protein